jgi:ATP-dependent DNA ligase
MDTLQIVIGIRPPTLRACMLAPTRIPMPAEVRWPVLASEKIEGVRCLLFPGFGARSRSGCSWHSRELRSRLAGAQAVADARNLVIEGELRIAGLSPAELEGCLRNPAADLDGLSYSVFDAINYREFELEAATPFIARHRMARSLLCGLDGVTLLDQRMVDGWEALLPLYRSVRSAGGEGLMIRRPQGLYRHGRCSMLEANLFKVRPLHPNSRQTDIPCGLEV